MYVWTRREGRAAVSDHGAFFCPARPWTIWFGRTCRADLVHHPYFTYGNAEAQRHELRGSRYGCAAMGMLGLEMSSESELWCLPCLLHMETEAQTGTVTCPESPRMLMTEAGLALRHLPFYLGVFLCTQIPLALLNPPLPGREQRKTVLSLSQSLHITAL